MNSRGYFGEYGGFFVPEILVNALEDLRNEYDRLKDDRGFRSELDNLLSNFAGRPTPLYLCRRLTERLKGPRIYLKREDLAHTGSHKINNALGQALLAKRMGKKRVIAETGAGQHGVATATACALLGLECEIYMGEVDIERQRLNCFRMDLLGAKVNAVKSGSRTLKDAINEAMRDFAASSDSTHYLVGSVVGPHPYPTIVRDMQSVIGNEARGQIMAAEGRLPDALVACVGGGSNAIGLFHPFIGITASRCTGSKPVERGLNPGNTLRAYVQERRVCFTGASRFCFRTPTARYWRRIPSRRDSTIHRWARARLPELLGRVRYVSVGDSDALAGFHLLSECEGIIPALESAHAVAYTVELARHMRTDEVVIVNLSGRGDKDVSQVARLEGAE